MIVFSKQSLLLRHAVYFLEIWRLAMYEVWRYDNQVFKLLMSEDCRFGIFLTSVWLWRDEIENGNSWLWRFILELFCAQSPTLTGVIFFCSRCVIACRTGSWKEGAGVTFQTVTGKTLSKKPSYDFGLCNCDFCCTCHKCYFRPLQVVIMCLPAKIHSRAYVSHKLWSSPIKWI